MCCTVLNFLQQTVLRLSVRVQSYNVWKVGVESFTIADHRERKKGKEKEDITSLTNFCKCLVEQGVKEITKIDLI